MVKDHFLKCWAWWWSWVQNPFTPKHFFETCHFNWWLGATWLPMTGPCGISPFDGLMPLVSYWLVQLSATCLPCQRTYPITTSQRVPCHLLHSQHADVMLTSSLTFWPVDLWLFTYLVFRSECDNFHIRSPFDEVNIWSKSGRRDRHNGIGFIWFWGLSFLSLFEPYQAPGSDSGSHLPIKGPFGPKNVTKMDFDWLYTHIEKNKTQCCTKMML